MYGCYRMFRLEMEKVERERQHLSKVKCGPLNCLFEVKLYRFRDYHIHHVLYSPPTSDDNVFEDYDNSYP